LCPWFGDYKECSYKNRVKGAEDYKKAKRLVKARRILQGKLFQIESELVRFAGWNQLFNCLDIDYQELEDYLEQY